MGESRPVSRSESGSATHSWTPCRTVVAAVETSGRTDARPGRHQVNFARVHEGVHTRAVAVLDFALEQPTDGLQPGVRVGRHVHPDAVADVVWAIVVGEVPRADQRSLPLRQRASHPDGARPAQRDFPGMKHTGECRCRASHFGRRGIGINHRATAALPGHRGADHVEVMVVDPEDAEAELVSPALLVLDEVEPVDQRSDRRLRTGQEVDVASPRVDVGSRDSGSRLRCYH